MSEPLVIIERRNDGVAVLTLNRPSARTAVNVDMATAIVDAVEAAQDARCIVITGADPAFCAGLDLRNLGTDKLVDLPRFIDAVAHSEVPTIAAVNGAAVGAGMSLALASDIIIAGESAYFLPSFARLGLVPDAGITFHLARRIGGGRSLSSLMLAEKIDAKTALNWGLAYAVVPDAEVVARAQAVARRLATGPCAVLGQIRSLHASTFDNSLQEQLRAERSAQEMTLETHDCVEGVRAFFEKREPNFSEH